MPVSISHSLNVAISQQLTTALRTVVSAPSRIRRLTPAQQARALRQLAQVEGAAHTALWHLVRSPGQRRPGS